MQHICMECGKIFVTELRRSKYCSSECYRKYIHRCRINSVIFSGDIAKIRCTDKYGKTQYIIVDASEYLKLHGKVFRVTKKDTDNTAYAFTENRPLHRIITACPRGMVVDHINHNGLDNRLANLRIVSCRANTLNRQVTDFNKSGCVGVTLKFPAREKHPVYEVYFCGEYLGRYKTLEEASAVRSKKEQEFWLQQSHV